VRQVVLTEFVPQLLDPDCKACARQVVLGYQYTMAIDMWSLGCVAAELFLGLPLFPGASEYDLLSRIVEMMGPPPSYVLATAKNTDKYFRHFESVMPRPMGALLPLETESL